MKRILDIVADNLAAIVSKNLPRSLLVIHFVFIYTYFLFTFSRGGRTLLHEAVAEGNSRLCNFVIKLSQSTSVNIRDKYGDTPLFLSIEKG